VEEDAAHRPLTIYRNQWLDGLKARGKMRAIETVGQAISDFLLITGHNYPHEITPESMDTFYTKLRDPGNADRTLFNKAMSLSGWFEYMKLDRQAIIGKPPAYTEKDVEFYHHDDIRTLLVACITD
jgi:hypothetical protein